MNLNHLNTFVVTAQCLNFTEAANRLHMVQSGVSHSISALEQELGIKLFIRNNKQVRLTAAGKLLLNDAYKILSLTADTESNLKQYRIGAIGSLSIGFVFYPIVSRYMPFILDFEKKHPGIKLQMNTYNSIDISQKLENLELDMGFARYQSIINRQVIEWRPLYKDELFVVMSKDNPLSLKPILTLEEVIHIPMISPERSYAPGMCDLYMELFMEHSLSPRIEGFYNDALTALQMVAKNKGYCILPGSWKGHTPADTVFVPIENTISHEIGIAWNKYSANNAIREFLCFLDEMIETE